MDLPDAALWVEVLTPALVVVAAIWRYERRLASRLDKQDNDMEWVKAELKAQFGGNSNGIRQAVDSQAHAITDVSARLDAHISQHIQRRN